MKKVITSILALLLALLMSTGALAFDGLKKGDRNSDVQALQLRLNQLGYSVGAADADYGNKTVAAVQAFQTDHGLSATGEVDEVTWNALYDEHVTITRDSHSADVKLAPPFTAIAVDKTSAQTALFTLGDVECALDLVYYTDLDTLTEDVLAYFKEQYDGYVTSLQASNFLSDVQSFTQDGRPGATIMATFDFIGSSGAKLTAYFLWSAVTLAPDGGRTLLARANTSATLNYGGECIVTADAMRDMVSSVTLLDEVEPDGLLGEWYMLSGSTLIVLSFHADGTYTGEFGGDPIGGVWRTDGSGYLMDDSTTMTLQGNRLTLGEGDDADVFQREPLAAPTLDTLNSAAEADFEGDWLITGLYDCDQNGLYDESYNYLDEGDEASYVSMLDGKLIITLFGEEEYDVSFSDGALRLPMNGGMFSGAEMHLLSDGTAVIYKPYFLCVTMQRLT